MRGELRGRAARELPHRPAQGRHLARDRQHRPELYGGSGVGNLGAVQAEDQQWHGQPASVALRVPPLGALWLHYQGE